MQEAITPRPMQSGTVRAWHLVVLYALVFMAFAVLSAKLSSGADPLFRSALGIMLFQALCGLFVLAISLAVPELRNSLSGLYRHAPRGLRTSDVLLFLGVSVTWSLGAERTLILLPLLAWKPGLYDTFQLSAGLPDVGAQFILYFLVAAVVIAPFAEELLFRGYLQNLLARRWGLWPGVALSALLFGAAHLEHGAGAAVSGIFYSLVYLKFRSLWQGTILHALHNVCVIFLLLAVPLFTKPRAGTANLSNWAFEIVLTLAFLALFGRFWRRFRPAD